MGLSGIWENEYVQELGIFDHCHEIITLKERIRIQKAVNPVSLSVQDCLEREMMDLYLILDKWVASRYELKLKRLYRFEEKGLQD